MPYAVEIENLTKIFPATETSAEKAVFQNLNIVLESGARLAITGKNGSGKTTLLKVLVNLTLPSAGSVKFFGQSVDLQLKNFRKSVAWVPACEQGFYSRLTGRENLLFFGALMELSKNEIIMKIDHLAQLLSLKDALDTPFFLCSNGMKQTLAIARGLMGDPRILLLDEPTRGLDIAAAGHLISGLKALPSQISIIFSTHSANEGNFLKTHELTLGEVTLTNLPYREKHFDVVSSF